MPETIIFGKFPLLTRKHEHTSSTKIFYFGILFFSSVTLAHLLAISQTRANTVSNKSNHSRFSLSLLPCQPGLNFVSICYFPLTNFFISCFILKFLCKYTSFYLLLFIIIYGSIFFSSFLLFYTDRSHCRRPSILFVNVRLLCCFK